ncbi:MAG: amino acid adenylation domain-containing protein, partial [Rubrobacteraceae bacterium]
MDEHVNGQPSKTFPEIPDTEQCLHRLVEKQARRTPDAPAVEDESISLTYEELDRKADLLAAHLRAEGIGPDEIVGVFMDPCALYVVACLAALKAGGAYLPLELAYPDTLLAEVADDAELRVVITQDHLSGRLPEEQTRFCLDDGWENRVEKGELENVVEPTQDNLAFVAYSSGTTGNPKGIANPHRAPVRSYLWRFDIVDYEPGDRAGCNIFFVWEVWRPLLRGATTVIIPDDVIYDPAALISFLEERKITEVMLTPSLLGSVLDAGGPDIGQRLRSLKTLMFNGEVVTQNLARRTLDLLPDARAINVYSISETHEIAAGDVRDLLESTSATYCPVGRPADLDRTYVLDEDMNTVPDGERGELYVGGDLLARGYVKLPEVTAKRFVEDPFSPEDGARMYRTGDEARLLSDGNLEILGRVDFMAKVRGYSVQLGAVEAAIEEHLAVWDCVVVADGDEGEDKRLVAYLVRGDEEDERFGGWEVDHRTGRGTVIRRRLTESLPHYMIPAVYVEVDSLPLQDSTGKVDRDNLPDPPARAVPASPAEFTEALPADAPRAEKEVRLARIFESVLLQEEGDVRRDDDFFDVGGHSLAAAELVEVVEDAFGARLPIQTVLDHPTVAGMCDQIEALQRGEVAGERQATVTDLRAGAVLETEISPRETDADGPVALRDAENVFLTGATGFLGAFLLDELLVRTNATVHCLVRPRKGSWPMDVLRDNLKRYGIWGSENARRIFPVVGDLGEPLFGLNEGAFDELARKSDVIFHSAAAVNLAYPYSALEAANVGGTREALRLACRDGAKPVHFVSSNGIFAPDTGLCEEDADLDSLAEAREDGYGQSKWVAEKLVWQAAERGLPVSVYRPGNISGHSESGTSNPRDLTGAIVAGSMRLGLAPEVEGWRMEMTTVDFVARAIRAIADRPEEWGRAFHLADPAPPPADEVFSWLEDAGYDLDRVPYADWLEAANGASQPDA